MDCLCRDGEIPGGSCERKFQGVAFACDVRKFKFPSVPVVLCWRVGDEIVGLARMNKPVRNCVWRAAMSCSRIYALCGRKRWEEIEFAMRAHEVFSPHRQVQAYNNAKRAMRVFRETPGRMEVREWYKAYVSRLRLMDD